MALWVRREAVVAADGLFELPDGAIPVGREFRKVAGWNTEHIIYVEPTE